MRIGSLVADPLTATLSVVDIPDVPRVQIKREDSSATESIVTVIAEGFEDDSVAGKLTRLVFSKAEDGRWRVTSALEAFKCRRSEDMNAWIAGPCP